MIRLEVAPAVRRHPFRPGAVVPELGVLVVVVRWDVGRAVLVFYHFAVTDVHGVVEGIALADYAAGADRRLGPVLTVFHLEHATGAVVLRRPPDGRELQILAPGIVDHREPPDLGLLR